MEAKGWEWGGGRCPLTGKSFTLVLQEERSCGDSLRSNENILNIKLCTETLPIFDTSILPQFQKLSKEGEEEMLCSLTWEDH